MLGVALRLLRRRALAEEAVQDSFALLWRHSTSFDSTRGGGRTWLYAILRHRSLNILRDEGRPDSGEQPAADENANHEAGAEDIVARLSEAQKLRHCLEALEPQRRIAIVMTYAHGLSHGELASRLGMPPGAVKSWLRRSLIALRECMG